MTRIVKKRHVFYLSGFDPRGAGHYHHLYKTHAQLQGGVNGLDIRVSTRQKESAHAHSWQAQSGAGDLTVSTRIEFLCWRDIICRHWRTGMLDVLSDLWLYIRTYIFTGLFWRLSRGAPQRQLAGLYPVVYVLLSFFLGLAAWIAIWQSFGATAPFAAAVLGGILALGIIKISLSLGNRNAAFWLLRVYLFGERWATGAIQGLDTRLAFFSQRIEEVLRDESIDEVIVVAHSVGTMLAVPVMASVLRSVPAAVMPAGRLSLLTLGQCIPFMSLRRDTADYRTDLEQIAQDKRLFWADYTAPADGACFPQFDPVRKSGLAPVPGAGPHMLSPRFFKLYAPKKYRRLRYDWFKMHFLYLMSTDYRGDYDYFAMTAGPERLSARLRGV